MARTDGAGRFWEGRFKSSLVDSADYCLICHLYIELNPVRAAMAQSPADYRWSSHHFTHWAERMT